MRYFRDLLLTALLFAGAVLALEVGLRLAGVKFESSFYTLEDERGFAGRPGAEGWTVAEGENYVRMNSVGMRDKDRELARPPDVIRIAVIGSSEAEAHQVPIEQTFEGVMERQLTRAITPKGRRVEVLNFAVPGYGLAQEYLTLHNHVWRYHPQIVVLATNEYVMLRNTRALYPGPTQGTPFYVLDHGELTPDRETLIGPKLDPARLKWKDRFADLMNHSRILLAMNQARINAPQVKESVKSYFHLGRAVAAKSPELSISYRMFDPDYPKLGESWKIGNAFFKLMKKDAGEHGAEFWIVILDMERAVHPDVSTRVTLERALGLPSLLLADERIAQLAKRDGIPNVNLTPALADYALQHQVALHGFFNTAYNNGHWNATGHEQAGLLITRALLDGSALFQ